MLKAVENSTERDTRAGTGLSRVAVKRSSGMSRKTTFGVAASLREPLAHLDPDGA